MTACVHQRLACRVISASTERVTTFVSILQLYRWLARLLYTSYANVTTLISLKFCHRAPMVFPPTKIVKLANSSVVNFFYNYYFTNLYTHLIMESKIRRFEVWHRNFNFDMLSSTMKCDTMQYFDVDIITILRPITSLNSSPPAPPITIILPTGRRTHRQTDGVEM